MEHHLLSVSLCLCTFISTQNFNHSFELDLLSVDFVVSICAHLFPEPFREVDSLKRRRVLLFWIHEDATQTHVKSAALLHVVKRLKPVYVDEPGIKPAVGCW